MGATKELIMELEQSLVSYAIPGRMHHGIILYIIDHRRPGDFLYAVITNNLKEAVGRADDKNVLLLQQYVRWFYNYAPSPCWGSVEKVSKWLDNDDEEIKEGM